METKEIHWTSEEISKFRKELSERIEKSEYYIKNFNRISIISLIISLYAMLTIGFSLIGLVIILTLLVCAFIFWCYSNKHKTTIIFCKAGLSIPNELY